MSNILNYTTTVPVTKTLGEIQGILAGNGAKQIMIDYGSDKEVKAISFIIETQFGERAYKLPANVEACYKKLAGSRKRPLVYTTDKQRVREQANMVAWRIVKDWIEATVALIQLGMVTLDEPFMPYMLGATGKTTYQLYCEKYQALPEGRDE